MPRVSSQAKWYMKQNPFCKRLSKQKRRVFVKRTTVALFDGCMFPFISFVCIIRMNEYKSVSFLVSLSFSNRTKEQVCIIIVRAVCFVCVFLPSFCPSPFFYLYSLFPFSLSFVYKYVTQARLKSSLPLNEIQWDEKNDKSWKMGLVTRVSISDSEAFLYARKVK